MVDGWTGAVLRVLAAMLVAVAVLFWTPATSTAKTTTSACTLDAAACAEAGFPPSGQIVRTRAEHQRCLGPFAGFRGDGTMSLELSRSSRIVSVAYDRPCIGAAAPSMAAAAIAVALLVIGSGRRRGSGRWSESARRAAGIGLVAMGVVVLIGLVRIPLASEVGNAGVIGPEHPEPWIESVETRTFECSLASGVTSGFCPTWFGTLRRAYLFAPLLVGAIALALAAVRRRPVEPRPTAAANDPTPSPLGA